MGSLKRPGAPVRVGLPNRDKQEETSHVPPWREAKVTSLSRCNACAGLAIPRQSLLKDAKSRMAGSTRRGNLPHAAAPIDGC